MQIQLKLFASLRRFLPSSYGGKETIELPEGVSIAELLKLKAIPLEEAKVILVNGSHSDLDYQLQLGDVLSVFPLVAGG